MPKFYISLALSGFLGVAAPQALPNDASLVHIEGAVYLDDQIVSDLSAAMKLGRGGVVRTGAGQAAVWLRKGGTLLIAAQSSVRVHATDFYNFNRIEVLGGSAIVISAESSPTVVCTSETRLSSAGVFRFDVQPADSRGKVHCRLRVFEGALAMKLTSLIAALRPGQTTMLPAGDMIPVNEFSPTVLDDFDRWSRQHAVKAPR